MKKAYISVDFEGLNGVTTIRHITPDGGLQYQSAQKQLHKELNSLIEGIKDAGIGEITVNDAHFTMDNIMLSDINSDVQLISGKPKSISMMHGLDSTYDCVFFLAYHTKAGAEKGVLSHTFNMQFEKVILNGISVSEAQLNSIYAAHLDVPIVFASGDDAFCREIIDDIGFITTVETKKAVSYNAAVCRKNDELLAEIKAKAKESVLNEKSRSLYDIKPPYKVEVHLKSKEKAYGYNFLPCTSVVDNVVEFTTNSYEDAYKFLQNVSANV